MAHEIDGYELAFTGRKSWKAEWRLEGKVIGIIPVTWTKAMQQNEGDRLLEVWIRDPVEREKYRNQKEPFVVALAEAKDYQIQPHSFRRFLGIYEVVATGNMMDHDSIETKVKRRLYAPISSPNFSTLKKLTRISYNSKDWRKPTGDAAHHEAKETYNSQYGFGHEDWLFRNEWEIAGWRYAFLQGVNKSHKKLVEANEPFDVTLFTVQPDKKRRYVADIHDAECLTDAQAEAALEEFEKRGWLNAMTSEIVEVSGDASVLGHVEWAKHTLNVRFRLENVTMFTSTFADESDPIQHYNRYQLYDAPSLERLANSSRPSRGRKGSTNLPVGQSYIKRGTAATEVSPEHTKMQARLMSELITEFHGAKIIREENYIDVLVETKSEIHLYEIKSDLSSRTVVRKALGQLLEYAFANFSESTKGLQLTAVGRRPLSIEDESYLQHLRQNYHLPINYRVVRI
jgi:hypothetical protein